METTCDILILIYPIWPLFRSYHIGKAWRDSKAFYFSVSFLWTVDLFRDKGFQVKARQRKWPKPVTVVGGEKLDAVNLCYLKYFPSAGSWGAASKISQANPMLLPSPQRQPAIMDTMTSGCFSSRASATMLIGWSWLHPHLSANEKPGCLRAGDVSQSELKESLRWVRLGRGLWHQLWCHVTGRGKCQWPLSPSALRKDKNIFSPLLMTHYNIKKSFPLFLIKKIVKICLALWKTRLYINISHTENLFIDFSLIISTVDTILKVLSLKPDTSVRVNRSCISFW